MGLLSDPLYSKPTKYEILFQDPITLEQVSKYDMFDFESNSYGLIDLEFDDPFGEIPFARMVFDDPENNIDLNQIRKGQTVIIQGTKDKSQLPLYNYFYGFLERVRESEDIMGNMTYEFQCSGNLKILYNSIGNYIVNPNYKNVRKGFANLDLQNEQYSIYNHLLKILTNKDILPSNLGYTLQERGNFDLSLLNEELKEIYPSMYKPYTRITDIINELANYTGSIWGVNPYNQVYFHHMQERTLGHILQYYEDEFDNPDRVSIIQDWGITRTSSIDSNDGYFDINFGFVKQSNIYEMGGDMVNYATTYNKDLCVRVKAGTSRFRNLILGIMRVGSGTDANKPRNAFITGHIANDNNGQPGDKIVAKFKHPILEVPESPTLVTMSIKTEPEDINVNEFYWIILHERGDGEDNCIRWYHDSDRQDSYTDRYVGMRVVEGGRNDFTEAYIPDGWALSVHGPTFSYAFANYATIPNVSLNAFTRNTAQNRAPVETVTTIDWIRDPYSMNKFLNLMSFAGSEEPVFFEFERCSIPNNPLRSGYTALLYTNKIAPYSKGGVMGTMTNIRHQWTGTDDEDAGPMGNTLCSVDFVGYFSQLDYKDDLLDPDDDY